MTLFNQGTFIASALKSSSFPDLRSENGIVLPEIALAGKSNVGKSSLINFLTRSSGLAKVSSTPGKTQTINFFSINQTLSLVDLPGYGYAKVKKTLQEVWEKHLEEYFQHRLPLELVLLLVDSRRVPSEEDLAMARWSAYKQKPLILIFTKSDKLTPKELRLNMNSALALFAKIDGLILQAHLPVSIHNAADRQALIQAINHCLNLNRPLSKLRIHHALTR